MTRRRLYLSQGADDVAKEHVGRSKKTVKAVGCTATAVAEAVNRLVPGAKANAVTVMFNALAAWDSVENSPTMVYGLDSASAIVGRLGNGNGVKVHDTVLRAQPKLRTDLIEALKVGNPVLLAVDKNGDTKTDHWLCALRLDGDDIIAADPDGGHAVRISRTSLEGHAANGITRYRVLGIRVITLDMP